MPDVLEVAIAGFVDYYNHPRYHKALSNVTPDDVLNGRREGILIRRSEMKAQTLQWRQRYSRHRRASSNAATPPFSLLNKSVPLLLVANKNMLHNKACVLVVEDDPRILRLERMVLEKEGYTVLTTGTGEETLGTLAESSP